MNRNKLNFEEISQSMEVLDRDSQRGVKGGNDVPNDDCVDYNIVLPEVVVTDTPIYKNFTNATFWSRPIGFGSSFDSFYQGGFGSESYFGGGGGGGSAQGVGWVLNSPVGDATISSEFNSHRNCSGCSQTHGGTDYAVPINTAVMATASGTVARAYLSSTYGNVVIVNHGPSANGGGNVYTLY